MYLVRQYRRDGKLKLALATERDVRASFPQINRRAKHQPFPRLGTLVESTGKYDKTRVDLTLNRDTTKDERGRDTGRCFASVKLADVSATVRRLPNESCEPLALNAQAIEAKLDELKVLRDERAELVRAAWRRSRKSVGARELEQLVERTASIDKVPARALVLTPEQKEQMDKDKAVLDGFARKVLGG